MQKKLDIIIYKLDYINRSGSWRGNNVPSLYERLSKESYRGLFLAYSDKSLSFVQYSKLKSNFDHIFSINVGRKQRFSKLSGIPLGLTNFESSSFLHSLFSDKDLIIKVLETTKQPKMDKVLISFNGDNCYIRSFILDLKLDSNLYNFLSPVYTKDGREEYLKQINSHKFVLCPRGNGLDTHRFWETLYCGSVPIISKSDLPLRNLERYVPILIIDSYSCLKNKEYIENRISNFVFFEPKGEILRSSFWANYIMRKLSNA